jgi:predicted ATP-grasp superfamily ATP-dependent carboligase
MPMIAAARTIVKKLQLSGFHGYDFVLEDGTGRAYLIEINPRATQINHFAGHKNLDLTQVLFNSIAGRTGATVEK